MFSRPSSQESSFDRSCSRFCEQRSGRTPIFAVAFVVAVGSAVAVAFVVVAVPFAVVVAFAVAVILSEAKDPDEARTATTFEPFSLQSTAPRHSPTPLICCLKNKVKKSGKFLAPRKGSFPTTINHAFTTFLPSKNHV
jgi:hypothetical protein